MPNQYLDKDDPLKGKKSGKWSKYGGAIGGLVKEKIKDDWWCQTCGEKQPKEFKPFLFEYYPGDFIRLCNPCFNLASHVSGDPVNVYRRVVKVVRKTITY